MERYDIAIIGTGPAGLEAAITAKIRNKKILLLGSRDLSLKVEKAPYHTELSRTSECVRDGFKSSLRSPFKGACD